MSNEQEVTLESLVGEHELSGVDTGHVNISDSWCGDEACETLTFVLDGETYTVTEDPSDGYRSAMRSLVLGGVEVKNCFTPQKVICSYVSDGDGEYGTASDLLVMRDAVTGKDVLTIGTGNTDDYYPYFVANFNPAAMACNSVKP